MRISRDALIRATVISFIIGYLLFTYPSFDPFPQKTAQSVAKLLTLYTGVTPVYHNNHVFLNLQDSLTVISISSECSGVAVLSVFTLIIFIIPFIKLWQRFCALLFLPVIYLANILRIVSGVIIGDYTSIEIFLLYHSSIGQVLIFLVMIAMFVMFLRIFGYFKYDSIKKGMNE